MARIESGRSTSDGLAVVAGAVVFALATVFYFRYGSFFYVVYHCRTGNNCTVYQMFPFIYWFVAAGLLTYAFLKVPFRKPEPTPPS